MKHLRALLHLPEDLPVTADHLHLLGITSALIHHYVKQGYLIRLPGQAYLRPGNGLTLHHLLYSVQAQGHLIWAGGLSALEHHGLAHHLPPHTRWDLYAHGHIPLWVTHQAKVQKLGTLFTEHHPFSSPPLPVHNLRYPPDETFQVQHLNGIEKSTRPPATPEMPLFVSSPERAFLELLKDAPGCSFDLLDHLAENLTFLRPGQVQSLLSCCTRVKVKRLFLYFGKRHQHPWYTVLLPWISGLNLGTGKRQVYPGVLDPEHLITVPRECVAME